MSQDMKLVSFAAAAKFQMSERKKTASDDLKETSSVRGKFQ